MNKIQLQFYILVLRLLQIIVLKINGANHSGEKEALEQSFDLADEIKKELVLETLGRKQI